MMKTRFSVDFILRAAVRRLLFFGVAAIVIAFLSQFYVLSLQSHRAACETVSARLNQFMGPLSRELAVGEIEVAGSMFEDFKRIVASRANSSHLEMNLSTSDTDTSNSASVCESSMWGANVFAPVSFAGRTVAIIQGQVTYFPTLPLIGFAVFVIGALMWGVRLWAVKLITQIESLVIAPIKQLSHGEEIVTKDILPYEVEDVSANIRSLKAKLVAEEKNSSELARQKELSELAVQVAHDIRGPVAAINELLKLAPISDLKIQSALDKAVGRINSVANGLLSQDASRSEIESSTIYDLNLVIQDIATEKRLLFPYGIIEATSPSPLLVETKLTQNLFSRILSNLIDNAMDACVTRKYISITAKKTEECLEVSVRDTGVGIDKESLKRVGEKGFSLLKPSGTKGTGRGVFSAKQILSSIGGGIALTSAVGEGTTVVLRIPARVISLELSPMDLILVDNDELDRMVWAARAEAYELRVGFFSSVSELMACNDAIPKQIPIFLDSDLGNKIKGESFAPELRNRGFKQIYVTTNFAGLHGTILPGVDAVIAKNFDRAVEIARLRPSRDRLASL